ncbi:serine/threonine-protein kinase [Streptomyces sp. SID161]|uniref:protein kinase domain-containing protein n=1 Tax=Streptomyces sp. SID161 TaxID=2690251 RepID=UPI00136BE39F|nr:protein kinase [Streptomyces sp. SID161]
MENTLIGGRFRLRKRLGAGGMGVVWQAEDIRMERRVAVKLVFTDHSGVDPGEIHTRFKREVRSAGRLSHRNIVTVHDFGEESLDGRTALFLVMELVEGTSLAERLDAQPASPPWQEAAAWVLQIAEALTAVHEAGIVHRDIKPGNVLLTGEGTVKLLDFGIARLVGDTLRVNGYTRTGSAIGTAGYMSPEQALARPNSVDHRSDLYSLGCLLYHGVTGRPPFTGSFVATLMQHLQDPPRRPDELAPGIPDALTELILALLAKEPGHRPANATAVQDVLETILLDEALQEPEGPGWSHTRLPAGLGGELALRFLDRARAAEAQARTLSTEAGEDRDHARMLRDEAARERAEAERERAEAAWLLERQADADARARRDLLAAREHAETDAAWTVRRAGEEAERTASRLTGQAETAAFGIISDARAEAADVLRRAHLRAEREGTEITRAARETHTAAAGLLEAATSALRRARLDAERAGAEITRRAREAAESEAAHILRDAQTEVAWITYEAARDRAGRPDRTAMEVDAAWAMAEADLTSVMTEADPACAMAEADAARSGGRSGPGPEVPFPDDVTHAVVADTARRRPAHPGPAYGPAAQVVFEASPRQGPDTKIPRGR